MEEKTWEFHHVHTTTNRHTHMFHVTRGRVLDKRGILSSWWTTFALPSLQSKFPRIRIRYKITMSSDLSSPLSSPKAKKTVTRTKKAVAKPVKATKGDHPSWKDIIRVRSSPTVAVGVKLTCLSGMYCRSPR